MAWQSSKSILVHATTISLNGYGVMIRGPSGSGKSDLALRLIETVGFGAVGMPIIAQLVADDQTEIYLKDKLLYVRPPVSIAGKLEVRGLAIVDVHHEQDVPLSLVVDLLSLSKIERLPERQNMVTEYLGHRVARCDIDPTLPSAASRVRLAWARTRPPEETAH
jgi:HPr kinase/phosphorylase